uniref:C2H2-type domain-containing protein n=1 Tax=Haemonchus contortus TaxID=6289 RepID=A0A7I4YR73_HAECO|nr:hypothetical protein LOC100740813 [Haemonchus contortus]
MAVFICVELESIVGLPEIMNCLLEKSIKFTVSKDRRSLCDTCSAKDDSLQLSSTTSITPVIPTSTPSSISLEPIESYPRSESVDSEVHDMVKSEDCTAQFSDAITPVNDEMDETDLVACGSELLQQVSANFSSYQERPKNFTDNEMSMIREKGAGSAPKQCQLCGHWITAKNVRAHVATHLTIRRLRCTLCGQGFDRMNRASIHVEKCHAGDSGAKVESAMNAEQRKEIEMLARKCFPRRNRSSASEESK